MSDPKWIEFVEQGNSVSGRTKVWRVQPRNSDETLGLVKWYGAWRKYCFFPHNGTVSNYTIFEWDCLRDIADFLEAKTKDHREVSESIARRQDLQRDEP